jgi:hypothetical protein
MPKHPLKPAEIRPPFIKPDADFDVWIGGFGGGRNDRITVIKTAVLPALLFPLLLRYPAHCGRLLV